MMIEVIFVLDKKENLNNLQISLFCLQNLYSIFFFWPLKMNNLITKNQDFQKHQNSFLGQQNMDCTQNKNLYSTYLDEKDGIIAIMITKGKVIELLKEEMELKISGLLR